MTKRERITATLAGQPVDRPACSFWRHVPELDHDPKRLADAMLTFHERWNLDFIKVMSSGVYCVEDWGCKVAYRGAPSGAKQCVTHAIQRADDWARIRPLDPGAGALGRELEAVRWIAEKRGDDGPILHTVFSPLTVARKLAGDALREHLATTPDTVQSALEAITATLGRYGATAIEAGANGIFFATQTATPETVTEEEFTRWEAPYARRVLESLQGRSTFTLLHLHGRDVYFDQMTALPIHAVNWHDRITTPSLAQARERFAGALAGGLHEWQTLLHGPPATIADEVQDAIRQTSGVGLIVTGGCGLPLAIPDDHLAAAVDAVRRASVPR